MCGITGVCNLNNEPVNCLQLKKITDTLKHRGPDDEGYVLLSYYNEDYKELIGDDSVHETNLENIANLRTEHRFDLAFGHRRLSIIDLSPSAHQPMSNDDKTLWIVYNGEIYNYIELREELEDLGHTFKSKSDTEVVLHAYNEWGVDCLQKFNGMWAFAIWDANEKILFCARDRFGIKPLYYFYDGKQFIFASELKSLLEYGIEKRPNDTIIYDYLAFGLQDHTAETFFVGIKQLKPAHYLLIENGVLNIEKYWEVKVSEDISGKNDNEDSNFYKLFEESIKLRLRSDVPVGTCLSGGLDSSSIVCIANNFIDAERQKTFSSCFDIKKYDEREYIEEVIEQTRVDTNQVFPRAEAFLDEIEDLIYYQDEPFGSLSIYAQWNVMRKASEKVKVLLDGQGGDELLAGYLEYYASFFKTLICKKRYFELARELTFFLALHPRAAYELFSKMRMREKRKEMLSSEFISKHKDREVKYAENLATKLLNDLTRDKLPALLHYEDRNSMAFSIEARVPFLDFKVVEYAAKLPLDKKLKNGMTKVILRATMKSILPGKIRTRRDKMGFVTPEEVWMKTVLTDWMENILSSESFKSRRYWDAGKVLKEFEDIYNGKEKYSSDIWRYACLELWLRRFVDEGKSKMV